MGQKCRPHNSFPLDVLVSGFFPCCFHASEVQIPNSLLEDLRCLQQTAVVSTAKIDLRHICVADANHVLLRLTRKQSAPLPRPKLRLRLEAKIRGEPGQDHIDDVTEPLQENAPPLYAKGATSGAMQIERVSIFMYYFFCGDLKRSSRTPANRFSFNMRHCPC